jgi:hypothetical protein
MKNYLFEPLGMTLANCSAKSLTDSGNFAHPYQVLDGVLTKLKVWNVDVVAPAASVNCTAIDMSKWLAFLVNKGQTINGAQLIPKEIFETAFTRYLYSREEIFNGSRVEVDTSTIKHFDLFDKAGAIEKLVGSGAFKINEVRRRANYQATDDPIGEQHLVTKNFGTAEDITGQRLEESEGSGDGS